MAERWGGPMDPFGRQESNYDIGHAAASMVNTVEPSSTQDDSVPGTMFVQQAVQDRSYPTLTESRENMQLCALISPEETPSHQLSSQPGINSSDEPISIYRMMKVLTAIYNERQRLDFVRLLQEINLFFRKFIAGNEFNPSSPLIDFLSMNTDLKEITDFYFIVRNMLNYLLSKGYSKELMALETESKFVAEQLYLIVFDFRWFIYSLSYCFGMKSRETRRSRPCREQFEILEEELIVLLSILLSRVFLSHRFEQVHPSMVFMTRIQTNKRYHLKLANDSIIPHRLNWPGFRENQLVRKVNATDSVSTLLSRYIDVCCICREVVINGNTEDFAILSSCDHLVCLSCAEMYFMKLRNLIVTCPMCRGEVDGWTTKKFFEAYKQKRLLLRAASRNQF